MRWSSGVITRPELGVAPLAVGPAAAGPVAAGPAAPLVAAPAFKDEGARDKGLYQLYRLTTSCRFGRFR